MLNLKISARSYSFPCLNRFLSMMSAHIRCSCPSDKSNCFISSKQILTYRSATFLVAVTLIPIKNQTQRILFCFICNENQSDCRLLHPVRLSTYVPMQTTVPFYSSFNLGDSVAINFLSNAVYRYMAATEEYGDHFQQRRLIASGFAFRVR